MKELVIIDNWKKITLAQYEEICRLQEQHSTEEATPRVIEYLYGVENAEQLPLPQYMAMVEGLRRLNNNPVATEKMTPAATYTVEGRRYDVDLSPTTFTAGQYIDFTNHLKNKGGLSDLLTVVMIPHDHAYNDGYDMAAVKSDLLTLPASAAFAVVGFFVRWSAASIRTFLRCLTKWAKRNRKVNREQAERLEKAAAELQHLLASYPLFSPIAN